MNILRSLCGVAVLRKLITKSFRPSTLEFSIYNLPISNPVGLGAGFDKNAKYLRELEALGFGFVEIGTVTPLPQDGNPKPRLFRLPKDKALINRMGFNNDGADQIVQRLKEWRKKKKPAIDNGHWVIDNEQSARGGAQQAISAGKNATTNNKKNLNPLANPERVTRNPQSKTPQLILGGNIGKNKQTPNEDAWKDYEICFDKLFPYVDYFVVNVSSPNTPGLRELQEKESLRKILTTLQTHRRQAPDPKPVLLKIAPDLTTEQIDDVIDLAMEINLDGLVAANTTLSREHLVTRNPKPATITGGLSGAPLQNRSTEIVRYIHKKTNGKIPIIASGGIFTGGDAIEKLNAGAALVQVWTGFIYEGPGIVKKIMKELDRFKKSQPATRNP